MYLFLDFIFSEEFVRFPRDEKSEKTKRENSPPRRTAQDDEQNMFNEFSTKHRGISNLTTALLIPRPMNVLYDGVQNLISLTALGLFEQI